MRMQVNFLALALTLMTFSSGAQTNKDTFEGYPKLPPGPPAAAPMKEVRKLQKELKGACTIALKKGEGLAKEVDIKKGRINSACECLAREVSKGRNLEEMDYLTSFYKGFDNATKSEDEAQAVYLHEASKLEANCRIDSSYRVGKPEPRLREINSVPTKSSKSNSDKSPEKSK